MSKENNFSFEIGKDIIEGCVTFGSVRRAQKTLGYKESQKVFTEVAASNIDAIVALIKASIEKAHPQITVDQIEDLPFNTFLEVANSMSGGKLKAT